LWESISLPGEHDFPECVVGFHELVGSTDLVESKYAIHYGLEPATRTGARPFGEIARAIFPRGLLRASFPILSRFLKRPPMLNGALASPVRPTTTIATQREHAQFPRVAATDEIQQ
jgi:hypothetical protein